MTATFRTTCGRSQSTHDRQVPHEVRTNRRLDDSQIFPQIEHLYQPPCRCRQELQGREPQVALPLFDSWGMPFAT